MGLTVKDNKIEPLNILIDFFASLYDLVYDFTKLALESIVKLALKIKKVASLENVINFFAFQYDVVYYFFKFLIEYIKWITSTRSTKSPVFVTNTEQATAMERI